MKLLLKVLFFLSFSTSVWSQCNVVATAMANNVQCYGDCNGSITYVYQNTGAPGAPYIVSLMNQTTGQTLSVTTYIQEFQTIPYPNLCAGVYQIAIQGQGCSFTTYATIGQPTQITAYVNPSNPSPGQNNGSATIIASGGSGAFTYSLNGTTYQSSNIFSGLAAGTYTAYAQDANGCIEQVQFTLTSPTQCNIVVTAYGSGVICNGACNAVVQYAYNSAGNNGPYTIELQNMNGQVLQAATNASASASGAFQNVCAGSYIVLVTDANGCSGFYTYTVSQPSQLLVTNVSTTNAAYGTNNGSATITASGGTPGYTYSLNGTTYQGSNTFTGLSAGVYIAYVKDQNGCISIYTFVIQETTACSVIMTSQATPVNCYGTCTGSITYVYTMALVAPVTVVLQNNGSTIQSTTGQFTAGNGTFNNLCAGNYSVTITDGAGCTYVNNVQVTQPQLPLTITAQSSPTTAGNSNGSIVVTASGGTAPYQYSINGSTTWQSSNTFTGLGVGVYIIYVQDVNGCIAIYCVQLTTTTGCDFYMGGFDTPTSCSGSSDGSIMYNYNDPMNSGPYVIELIQNGITLQTTTSNNNGGTGTYSNLPAGIYTVQITNAAGCIDTYEFFVDSPNPLLISNVIVTNATSGMSNGSAEVIVTGGTAPYQYSLNNGTTWSSSNLLTGLAAGVQILHVEDANGCTTIYCFVVNEDPACGTLVITANVAQPISCYGSCDGAIAWMYTSSGSAPPYVVTLTNNTTTISSTSYTFGTYQDIITGLCAGSYSVSVTDGNGCSASYNITLVQPQPLTVTVNSTSATTGSSNGSAIIYANGGSGQYSYSLNGTTWQSSNIFQGLTAGVHIAYVQDENGCMQIYTFVIGTQSNCNLVITANQTSGNQCGGSCTADIIFTYSSNGGTGPYTVTLSDQSGNTQTQTFIPGSASGSFNDLCNGVYIITVQDANGCSAIYTIQIAGPANMNLTSNTSQPTQGNTDGSIELVVSGGTSPYQYSIDNQLNWVSTNLFSNLGAGVYIVAAKDANVCTQVATVKLGQSTASIVELDQNVTVYPNPTKGIVFIESYDLRSIKVMNMNGQILQVSVNEVQNGSVIDLEGFSSGMYLLEVEMMNESIQRVNIVKE